MRPWGKFLAILIGFLVVWPVWSILLVLALEALFGGVAAGFLYLSICAMYAWMAFGFFHYRYVRQQEFLQLLTAVADAETPLAPAVWSFVRDRPAPTLREFWIGFLFFLPLPGYYWLWHRRHGYDRKLEDVACLLEVGLPLHQALAGVPGVVPRDMVLAAAIGQSTGRLGFCLQQATRYRVASAWLDAIPRLVYPVVLLAMVLSVLTFWLIFIMPKMEKIFADFKIKLPWMTEMLIGASRFVVKHQFLLDVLLISLVASVAYLVAFPASCRFVPVVGRLYRMHMQGRVLKMLGLLLDTGKTVPDAVGIMVESGYFGGADRHGLNKLLEGVVLGQPLAETMQGQQLLPGRMVAFVQAAQRARNLPWALAELGDHLARRSVQVTQRFTIAIFPVTVVAMGILVALVSLSMFSPLVQLLEGLIDDVSTKI